MKYLTEDSSGLDQDNQWEVGSRCGKWDCNRLSIQNPVLKLFYYSLTWFIYCRGTGHRWRTKYSIFYGYMLWSIPIYLADKGEIIFTRKSNINRRKAQFSLKLTIYTLSGFMALLSFREVFTAFDQLFRRAPPLENLHNHGENEKS